MTTMTDVARHAGVSQTTVSMVLNKSKRTNGSISEETRRRVLSSAAALNYRTNELAKAMVTGKSRVLGFLTAPYAAENVIRVLTGAISATEENDYLLKIMHLSYDSLDANVIDRCLKWQIAGVAAFGFSLDSAQYIHAECERARMPITLLDNAPTFARWGARLRSDDAQGIRSVVAHLIQKGHSRIGFLGGAADLISRLREEHFVRSTTEAGLSVSPCWVRHSEWYVQNLIEEAALALLSDAANRPTAIVCASDLIALVVYRVARSLGLCVPDDLSVTGYSDLTASAYVDPPLTTVDQHFGEMGRVAALQLIARAEGTGSHIDGDTFQEILLPTRLVLRSSTGPPR